MTYDECNRIMKIVKQGLLNKSRVSVSIPSSALYGPAVEGGLQLNHLYHTQGLIHLYKFVQFLDSSTITGKLIRVSLEIAIIEIGIGRNLFSLEYNRFHCLLSDSWIKNLWKFADEYRISIIDRITSFPLPQRVGDVFLMEDFAHQGYSKKKLQILNRCRIYLQVLMLSDIMTGNGDCFTMTFKCKKDHQTHNTYKWPHQPEPSTSMKKFWKKALQKTFGLRSRITSHKLGIWLHSNLSNWSWFFHP